MCALRQGTGAGLLAQPQQDQTQGCLLASRLFTCFKNKAKTTGFSISARGSQVAALSSSVPSAEVPCVPDGAAAGFLFQTLIF